MLDLGSARTADAGRLRCLAKRALECPTYDVSALTTHIGVLRAMLMKGHDGTRGNSSPRVRRTPPQCGQRADSAGAIALVDNTTLGNSSFRACCRRASRCRLDSKP